jgi:hypothetical protein
VRRGLANAASSRETGACLILTHNVRHSTLKADMITKKFWGQAKDRRSVERRPVDFYAIEVENGARYLRRITNLSLTGLLMEDRMNTQRPGAIMELELPRPDAVPVRLKAEVVRVTPAGQVALRSLGGQGLHGLGGSVEL